MKVVHAVIGLVPLAAKAVVAEKQLDPMEIFTEDCRKEISSVCDSCHFNATFNLPCVLECATLATLKGFPQACVDEISQDVDCLTAIENNCGTSCQQEDGSCGPELLECMRESTEVETKCASNNQLLSGLIHRRHKKGDTHNSPISRHCKRSIMHSCDECGRNPATNFTCYNDCVYNSTVISEKCQEQFEEYETCLEIKILYCGEKCPRGDHRCIRTRKKCIENSLAVQHACCPSKAVQINSNLLLHINQDPDAYDETSEGSTPSSNSSDYHDNQYFDDGDATGSTSRTEGEDYTNPSPDNYNHGGDGSTSSSNSSDYHDNQYFDDGDATGSTSRTESEDYTNPSPDNYNHGEDGSTPSSNSSDYA